MSIPRIIRGKVGELIEPEDQKGQWVFEMWLTTIGGGEGDSLGVFGPFPSKDVAHKELQAAAKLACEALEKGMGVESTGEYIDMLTNTKRRWDKKDEH